MDINYVQNLVQNAATKLNRKQVHDFEIKWDKNFKYDDKLKSLPDLNPIYVDSILEHSKVAVHAELDCFPYAILKSKAPNQSDDEWDYQMGLYECYTNSTWGRAKNKTKIIANSQNYAIEWPDEEQKKYFFEEYPDYHSLLDYFFDIVRDKKIDYPNQVLLIEPKYIPGYYKEDGEFIPDQTELISPIARLIKEKNIVDYVQDEYLFILDGNCSYKVGDIERHDGLVFRYYDQNLIMQINQTGVDSKYNPVFEYIIVYEHNWGWLPARKLMGRAVRSENGYTLYQSHYADAIPDLNDVIRFSATRSMSVNKMAYPVIIAVVDPCSYSDLATGARCNNGKIFNSTGETVTCPSCNGSGKANNHSPTGVYEVVARTQNGLADNILPMTPPVQFAAPDSSILDYLGKIIEEKKKAAFGHLFDSEDANAATATGKELEKEEFISFLTQFSNEFFALLEFTIEAIGYMRYGDSFQMPRITEPKSFSLKTNADITTELANAKKDGLPVIYQQRLLTESNNTRFNTNVNSEAELKFMYQIDRLWAYDSLTIRGMVGVTASKLEAIIHDSLSTFIENALAERPDFWELDYTTQKDMIYKQANEALALMQPATTKTDILAQANQVE